MGIRETLVLAAIDGWAINAVTADIVRVVCPRHANIGSYKVSRVKAIDGSVVCHDVTVLLSQETTSERIEKAATKFC